MADAIEQLGEFFQKAGGPYIGPRGGKWADAKHTIAWTNESYRANDSISEKVKRVGRNIKGAVQRAKVSRLSKKELARKQKDNTKTDDEARAELKTHDKAFQAKAEVLSGIKKPVWYQKKEVAAKEEAGNRESKLQLYETGLKVARAALEVAEVQGLSSEVAKWEKRATKMANGLSLSRYDVSVVEGKSKIEWAYGGSADEDDAKAQVASAEKELEEARNAAKTAFRAAADVEGAGDRKLNRKLADAKRDVVRAESNVNKKKGQLAWYDKVKRLTREYKSHDGIDGLGEYLAKAGGPFIGPRGGKWADAKHTIAWDQKKHGKPAQLGLFDKPKVAPAKQAATPLTDRQALAVQAIVLATEDVISEGKRQGGFGTAYATKERVIQAAGIKNADKAFALARKWQAVKQTADGRVVRGPAATQIVNRATRIEIQEAKATGIMDVVGQFQGLPSPDILHYLNSLKPADLTQLRETLDEGIFEAQANGPANPSADGTRIPLNLRRWRQMLDRAAKLQAATGKAPLSPTKIRAATPLQRVLTHAKQAVARGSSKGLVDHLRGYTHAQRDAIATEASTAGIGNYAVAIQDAVAQLHESSGDDKAEWARAKAIQAGKAPESDAMLPGESMDDWIDRLKVMHPADAADRAEALRSAKRAENRISFSTSPSASDSNAEARKHRERVERYNDKMDAKEARLVDRAAKKRAEAERAFGAADLSEEKSGIPMGQPILVGHHSEKRHRRVIERANAASRRGLEAHKEAQRLEARIAHPSNAISSEDPAAVQKLNTKIQSALQSQEQMKRANKLIKQKGMTPEKLAAALAWKLSTAQAAMTPDSMGKIGFPSYALTNNNANIRRMRMRIEQLKRETKVMAEAAAPIEGRGFRIEEDPDDSRIRFFFDTKTDLATHKKMRSAGFVFSRRNGAYQRRLNANGRYAAERMAKELFPQDEPLKPESPAPMSAEGAARAEMLDSDWAEKSMPRKSVSTLAEFLERGDYFEKKMRGTPIGGVTPGGKLIRTGQKEYTPIDEYKLQVHGEDHKKVAGKIKAGVEASADICKLSPPVCAGNLGIPRDNMPQISGEVETKFLAALKAKGVLVEKGEMPAGEMMATQQEIQAKKVVGMAHSFKEGLPDPRTGKKFDPTRGNILVSEEGYILDGHHRYAAAITVDPGAKMEVTVIHAPIKEILTAALKFPGVTQADLKGKEIVDANGNPPAKRKEALATVAASKPSKRSVKKSLTARQPIRYFHEHAAVAVEQEDLIKAWSDEGGYLAKGDCEKCEHAEKCQKTISKCLDTLGKSDVSPTKARQILHDGTVHGKPITEQQRKYFGAIGGHLPAPKAEKSMSSFSSGIDALGEYVEKSELEKSGGMYTGPGKRTGMPGNYKYQYDTAGGTMHTNSRAAAAANYKRPGQKPPRQGDDKKLADRIHRKDPKRLPAMLKLVGTKGLSFGSEESYEEMNAAHALVALGAAKYSRYQSDERFDIEATGSALPASATPTSRDHAEKPARTKAEDLPGARADRAERDAAQAARRDKVNARSEELRQEWAGRKSDFHEHLDDKGYTTAKDTARILGLTPEQAQSHLAGMVSAGKLSPADKNGEYVLSGDGSAAKSLDNHNTTSNQGNNMNGIDGLGEYLAKADTTKTAPQHNSGEAGGISGDNAGGKGGLPHNEPSLGNGPEQGGELAGKGKGDTGSGPNPPSTSGEKATKNKLSEDDEYAEVQMKDREALSGGGQKMAGRYRKSDSDGGYTQQELEHSVARERAEVVSRLLKGEPDLVIGGQLQKAKIEIEVEGDDKKPKVDVEDDDDDDDEDEGKMSKAQIFRHGDLVTYSDAADRAVEQLDKSGNDFYHGAPPAFDTTGSLRKSVSCGNGHQMSAALSSCPSCGVGTHLSKSLPGAGVHEEAPELLKSGRGLVPHYERDLVLPNGTIIIDDD